MFARKQKYEKVQEKKNDEMITSWPTGTPRGKLHLRVLVSECTDPATNLATEEYLQEGARGDCVSETLFLWRNRPTVVIGAHQNAARECDLKAMAADGVVLTRRRTGGGAVYHDLRNTNYSFIVSPPGHYAAPACHAVVTGALQRAFGLKAAATGRNDICAEDPRSGEMRKVSGCAFRRRPNAVLHHGTLLLGADLQALSRYLTPSRAKLMSKGVASVRSRVANVSDLVGRRVDHAAACRALAESFCATRALQPLPAPGGVCLTVEALDPERLARADGAFAARRDALRSYEWRFGHDPQWSCRFETRLPWGTVDARLDVAHGRVADIALFSDALNTAVVPVAAACLRGARFRARDVLACAAPGPLRRAAAQVAAAGTHTPAEVADAAALVPDLVRWIAANANEQ